MEDKVISNVFVLQQMEENFQTSEESLFDNSKLFKKKFAEKSRML